MTGVPELNPQDVGAPVPVSPEVAPGTYTHDYIVIGGWLRRQILFPFRSMLTHALRFAQEERQAVCSPSQHVGAGHRAWTRGRHVDLARAPRRSSCFPPKPAVYAVEDSHRFSETSTGVFVNFASAHVRHSNYHAAPSARVSATPAGHWQRGEPPLTRYMEPGMLMVVPSHLFSRGVGHSCC